MFNHYQLFLYTVDEYKRFAKQLPVTRSKRIMDSYSETDYIGIQVRLMLLRKYYSNSGNVSLNDLLTKGQTDFPDRADEFKQLLVESEQIVKQKIEHLLTDGTKLNIYETIEDTVYGLYLHADENRIDRLQKTSEGLRFICIREYILRVEDIVFELYDLLKKCNIPLLKTQDADRSPMVYLGNPSENFQEVTASSYWSNLYGHNATAEELKDLVQAISFDEKEMVNLCSDFISKIKEPRTRKRELKKYIHPAARIDWGDFRKAKEFFDSIPNPGISTKVRYNDAKDTAYVRVFPNVKGSFVIDTPHVLNNVYEFSLGKWRGQWKIYSFGGHLDSIYINK